MAYGIRMATVVILYFNMDLMLSKTQDLKQMRKLAAKFIHSTIMVQIMVFQ